MITIDKIILLLIRNAGGMISGKTLIQKRIYFLGKLLNRDDGYGAHYYGPYSSEVEEGLSLNKALGFVEQRTHNFGARNQDFEIRRYDYSLTPDGDEIVQITEKKEPKECEKIIDALKKMKDAGDNGDYMSLSIAAKTYYILSKQNRPMTSGDIHKEAKKLGWEINSESISRASSFLKKLQLIDNNSTFAVRKRG
ncbi:MAG: hypothetical protein HQK96_20955 [Nitrospirae bacterium]|nr:hypothetical protein [Nitrospirota bacterium]